MRRQAACSRAPQRVGERTPVSRLPALPAFPGFVGRHVAVVRYAMDRITGHAQSGGLLRPPPRRIVGQRARTAECYRRRAGPLLCPRAGARGVLRADVPAPGARRGRIRRASTPPMLPAGAPIPPRPAACLARGPSGIGATRTFLPPVWRRSGLRPTGNLALPARRAQAVAQTRSHSCIPRSPKKRGRNCVWGHTAARHNE